MATKKQQNIDDFNRSLERLQKADLNETTYQQEINQLIKEGVPLRDARNIVLSALKRVREERKSQNRATKLNNICINISVSREDWEWLKSHGGESKGVHHAIALARTLGN